MESFSHTHTHIHTHMYANRQCVKFNIDHKNIRTIDNALSRSNLKLCLRLISTLCVEIILLLLLLILNELGFISILVDVSLKRSLPTFTNLCIIDNCDDVYKFRIVNCIVTHLFCNIFALLKHYPAFNYLVRPDIT